MGGNCEIGEYSYLGMRSVIAENLKIAPKTFLTMGAIIRKDTKEDSIYYVPSAMRNKLVSSTEFFNTQQ